MSRDFIRSPNFWIRAASVVVVSSVALSLAQLTWRLVGWDDGRSSVYTPDRLAPLGGGTASGVESIVALAPFGGGVGADGLPASNLGLVLKGVIYSASPGASTALIAAGASAAQTYSVGQAPVGNALIDAIEMDHVVLSVGGRREVLTFPRVPAGPLAANVPVPNAASNTAVAAPPPDAAAASALAAASPIATALAAEAARTAAARPTPAPAARQDPAAALTAAGVSMSSEGYRLGPDAPPQLLRAGLRPGDLIRTLNGQPVGDLTSDRQLFERAAGATSARVEILRNGRPLTLTFPLR